MKILTIAGTRPELIRLSRIIPKLDKAFNHIFVYTDQNYDKRLRDIFFADLEIREPDYSLQAIGGFGTQVGIMLSKMEKILKSERPDKVLILGDTNSGLVSIVSERFGIPVYHMEAGNRCFDKIPEEINRKIIDHTSTINLPYTVRSRENLIQEGFLARRIFVSGNPITEVLNYYRNAIRDSQIMDTLQLEKGKFILATLHRSENVDNPDRFGNILQAYNHIANFNNLDVIISTHPRTASKLANLHITMSGHLKFKPAFGFFDYINLEKNCQCLLTDSGTAQEEAAILHIPCIVTRRATERPELVECGATILGGVETHSIMAAYNHILKSNTGWTLPIEYTDLNVSDKIIAYLGGQINV